MTRFAQMRKISFISITLILALIPCSAWSQSKKQYVRQGNKEYQDKKYADAEVSYRKALAKDSNYVKADYNLANSMYRQKHFKEANLYYQKLLEDPNLDKNLKKETYYNMGNSYVQQGLESSNSNPMESFQNAVDAYKNSLRIDPKDADAKYNLAYAMKYLQQEQQKQQQQNNDKNDNKQDKKDQQQQQNNNQQQQRQQQQEEQQQKEMKKNDAERILNALKNNEKQTLEKNKKKEKGKPEIIEKDW